MAAKAKTSRTFREKMLEAVERVDRPGSVCVWSDKPLVLPGLEVESVGSIRLPLGKTQARKLIKQCSQAPYGKGTETLVDTDVRRVWELDPAQFQLTNPQWDELVSSLTSEVQAGLGLENRKLKAHLYKLLVYEEGGFFLPHRDGEKLDGMVATLVVSLPSVHKGGELIVSHEGQRQKIEFAGSASGYELSYAAFYADCEHEVRPLREGYRLSLIYNLTLAQSRKKTGITAPRTGEVVALVRDLFRDWPDTKAEGQPAKVAIALEHQYSQEGLKIDTLKGIDQARAEVLFEAAQEADCVAHLALATHWQSGSAEGGDYGYRRYSRWSYDEEDEEPDGGTDHEMGEIYDESMSLDHWSDRQGRKIPLGRMNLQRDEIVSPKPPEEWELSREEFEGYTGNAGMTLERWYRRAAVVVWPQERHFEVLCNAGTDAAIAGLESMVTQGKQAAKSKKDAQRESCLKFAKAIIKTWAPRRHSFSSSFVYEPEEKTDRLIFPRLLEELDAPDLLRQFLNQIVPEEAEIELGKTFPTFCKKQGWETFQEPLTRILDSSSAKTLSRNASLLELLCPVRDKNADRIKLCRHLADRAVTAIEKLDKTSSANDWEFRRIDRASLLTSLVKALAAVEAQAPLKRLIAHTFSESGRYDLTDVHLKSIFRLESWLTRKGVKAGPAVRNWLSRCRRELEQRTKESPKPPTDFRRPAELSCQCSLCRELSKFLADPEASVHRFPLRKELRRHLHQIIDREGCDVTHVTSRQGSPHILVCTKTTGSYEKACQIYARDQKNLKRLETVERKIG